MMTMMMVLQRDALDLQLRQFLAMACGQSDRETCIVVNTVWGGNVTVRFEFSSEGGHCPSQEETLTRFKLLLDVRYT